MSDTPEARVHLFVSGNVQNVHFRDNAHETARAHDLTGWIRNLEDGRVEGVFEGSEGDVETMVEWCRTGPVKAEVEDVEIEVGDPQGDLEDFEKH